MLCPNPYTNNKPSSPFTTTFRSGRKQPSQSKPIKFSSHQTSPNPIFNLNHDYYRYIQDINNINSLEKTIETVLILIYNSSITENTSQSEYKQFQQYENDVYIYITLHSL